MSPPSGSRAKRAKLPGVEITVRASGRTVAYLAAHSLNGVLLYERDVAAYAANPEDGITAVHIRGVKSLRELAAFFSAVADAEETSPWRCEMCRAEWFNEPTQGEDCF